MLCCPMTTQVKGYPFEFVVAGKQVAVVLADQVKLLDCGAARAQRKAKVTPAELSEVRARLLVLLGSPN